MTAPAVRKSFVVTLLGKLGVPIIAGTMVGCLLSQSFDWLHCVLFAVGIGLEYAHHRLT